MIARLSQIQTRARLRVETRKSNAITAILAGLANVTRSAIKSTGRDICLSSKGFVKKSSRGCSRKECGSFRSSSLLLPHTPNAPLLPARVVPVIGSNWTKALLKVHAKSVFMSLKDRHGTVRHDRVPRSYVSRILSMLTYAMQLYSVHCTGFMGRVP